MVDEYGGPLYKFCRRLTYSREDADDLFQETFLKALGQKKAVNASDNPQGILFSTAAYIWKSWKRKYARRSRLAPVEPLDDYAAADGGPEEDYMAREETRVVRELVNILPDKYKIPIILYYTVEMSVHDIASSLNLPAGTVKSRLFKARKILEKGLVEAYEE
jgi:RNA polymerase sigma-70 factor (ECF subfamily)